MTDRPKRLLVREARPLNAEPSLADLRASFETPRDHFFLRNHGDVPAIDPASFTLTVDGLVERPLRLALPDLRAFPDRTVAATMQCAGNRREELAALAPIPGELLWASQAVGNASWTGPAFASVLAAARPAAAARHVVLEGLDETERLGNRFAFGGSIPLEKALSPEVILAHTMSGEPLAPEHGFPLRAVVPGWIGARSVKWLARITLSAEPSTNYFQRRAYRLFPAAANPGDVDWESGLMLGELPVNSVIWDPEPGSAVPAGRAAVRGFAITGGGRDVARVDVSTDDGETWVQARLDPRGGRWTWRLWEADVDLPPGPATLVARAWDSAAQTQPRSLEEVWNFKGYANNAWARVSVRAV